MRKKLILTFIMLFVCGLNCFASDNPYPYRLDFGKEAILLGAGVILYGSGYYVQKQATSLSLEEINRLDRNDVNFFDRSATHNSSDLASSASDYGKLALQLAPLALLLDDNCRTNWVPTYLMFTEGLIMVLGVTELSKGVVGRERPLMYNDDISNSDKLKRGEDGSMSFFSGHTSFSFYSAAFVSTVFSDLYPNSGYRYLVTGTSFAAASLVGYMRYEAGSHFPSDIIVGAAVGSAIGYLIPRLHRKKGSGIAVSPVFIGSSNGLMLSACF